MARLSASKCAVALTVCAALATQARAQSAGPAPAQLPLVELETILVIGEQPGPRLWKVSRDGHVLWLLGTYGPLPTRMSWRSQEVEAIVRESQEIYGPLGFRGSSSDARAVHKATHNVDGKTLMDLLPEDLYRRFAELNHEFGGGSGQFGQLRPVVAMDQLQDQALQKLKIASDGGVGKSLQRLARKHRVKFRSLTVKEDGKAVREMMKQLDAIPREQDIPCATARMDRLESTLNEAVVRANAWARGDIATLRQSLGVADEQPDACAAYFESWKPFMDAAIGAYLRGEAALREALRKNRSTLAMVPIAELLRPQGLLARFKADGYEIEEP